MQVNSGMSNIAMMMAQAGRSAAARTETPASFASSLVAKSSQSDSAISTAPASVEQADFTSMTRQGMRDWVNDKIRSGEMSLDDSTSFVGMTMKVRVSDNQIVSSSNDNERIDFIGKTRLGIEGAFSRNDQEEARQLQIALSTMLRFQGQTTSVDIRA